MFQKIYDDYLILFNGPKAKKVQREDAYSKEALTHYQMPSKAQVGNVADVNVGHIEHFRFHEEFQLDYHLRKAGFFVKLDEYRLEEKQKILKKL